MCGICGCDDHHEHVHQQKREQRQIADIETTQKKIVAISLNDKFLH